MESTCYLLTDEKGKQVGLFSGVTSDEVTGRKDLTLHRCEHRRAIRGRGIEVQLLAQREDLEVVGMGLACRRLRSDIAGGPGDVLALGSAAFESLAGGYAQRKSRRR